MTNFPLTGRAGQLTLVPHIVKTDLFGPGSDSQRLPAEFGRLLVPERRDNPHSQMIELAFVRVKSTASEPGPPLVFLAGGPGISGIDALRWENLFSWFASLRQVGDVIALDQRGSGRSIPNLDCLESWDFPIDQPGTYAETLRMARERCQSCAAFWQSEGVDLSGYTTQESADDIDALRVALGLASINLYGASYGSHLALATIKRHGAHVARAIVAMVEGLDHTIKLPSNIQQHIEHLARLVQADANLGPFIPDFLALMRTVFERLEREPALVTMIDQQNGKHMQVAISSFDLQRLTASGIGSRRFIANLPARYYAMEQGDFSWAAAKVLEMRRARVGSAMTYMMDCASAISVERLAQVQREAPQTLLGDLVNFPFPHIATAWGNPDLGPIFRAPFTSQVPTLFLSGTLDGRTPISNAQEVSAGFTQAQHIIVEGATHTTAEFVSAPGVTQAMLAFLEGKPVEITRSSIPFAFTPIQRSED